MSSGRHRAWLLVAILLVLASAGRASAASREEVVKGAIGVRLMDAPASAGDDPRARFYIVDHLAPGATIKRRIEVSNSSDATHDVDIYAAAARIKDGAFLGSEGRTANELSTWTSVSPSASAVSPHQKVVDVVTIRVPRDAAPGEQYGVVWAEARSEPGSGGGIVQVSRVGIRLYISIGPGGPPAADFAIESLAAGRSAQSDPTVSASVHNTGGRAIDVSGTLRLTGGPGGLSAGEFPVKLGSTLGIDDTQPVTIVLDARLPNGPWDATLSIASGLTERTARATITFPSTGVAPPVAVVKAGPTRPWLLPAIAAAVLAVLCALWMRRRRSRR